MLKNRGSTTVEPASSAAKKGQANSINTGRDKGEAKQHSVHGQEESKEEASEGTRLLVLTVLSADLEEDYRLGIEKLLDKADPQVKVAFQGLVLETKKGQDTLKPQYLDKFSFTIPPGSKAGAEPRKRAGQQASLGGASTTAGAAGGRGAAAERASSHSLGSEKSGGSRKPDGGAQDASTQQTSGINTQKDRDPV